jgi:hypothetical protein
MTTATLRRWLQPAPSLRWHPGAPIAALVLGLVFTFVAGVRWGQDSHFRQDVEDAMVIGTLAKVRMEALQSGAPNGPIQDARAIDLAVVRWHGMQQPSSAWLTARDFIEVQTGLRRTSYGRAENAAQIRELAEFRLRMLGGDAPTWAPTAGYCEWIQLKNLDFIRMETGTARIYSEVLGREIKPQQLVPAVPGGKC